MMDTRISHTPDPTTPIVMICLFCMNVCYGDRKTVHVHPTKYPMMNKPCPLCQVPLQLIGLHPGAWGGSIIIGIESEYPKDS
jgi:hypothetical protein